MQYPRDMIGYGANPPHPNWPNKARIAVQFVINYEEGSENCVLHGDKSSERFLSEIVGAESYPDMRHMNMESIYEYGSRSGFWRLHRLFTQHNLPVTVFGVAMALQRNPEAVEAMLKADWEIASHGYRWIDYQQCSIEDERADLLKAIKIHEDVTGTKPAGFYLGRCSPNTHKLVADYGDFVYHADSYADDLPYWESTHGSQQLIVPYTLDTNDMRFATPQGFNSGEQFFNYLKDSFDVLYEEGETQPKMLSIGLHCRLIGRPGRIASLARFLDYIQSKQQVWVTRRIDIANHWKQNFPAAKVSK
jgi:putative urate catabolism protein